LGYPNNNDSSSPYFAWSLLPDGRDLFVLAAQQYDLVQACPDGITEICDLQEISTSSVVWAQATVYSAAGAPGPLPLLGAGAAFGFSRKLRKRIKLEPAVLGSVLPQA
jgi:hypothetical protein